MGSDHPHSSLVGVSVHAPCPPGLCEGEGERTPGEISVARTLGARTTLRARTHPRGQDVSGGGGLVVTCPLSTCSVESPSAWSLALSQD